jgi:hypothetical protein
MRSRTRKLQLSRETLKQLSADRLTRVAAGTGSGCYPPTFAPTCYVGCHTASCPDYCN